MQKRKSQNQTIKETSKHDHKNTKRPRRPKKNIQRRELPRFPGPFQRLRELHGGPSALERLQRQVEPCQRQADDHLRGGVPKEKQRSCKKRNRETLVLFFSLFQATYCTSFIQMICCFFCGLLLKRFFLTEVGPERLPQCFDLVEDPTSGDLGRGETGEDPPGGRRLEFLCFLA